MIVLSAKNKTPLSEAKCVVRNSPTRVFNGYEAYDTRPRKKKLTIIGRRSVKSQNQSSITFFYPKNAFLIRSRTVRPRSEAYRENGNENFSIFFQNESRPFIPIPYSTPVHAYEKGRVTQSETDLHAAGVRGNYS